MKKLAICFLLLAFGQNLVAQDAITKFFSKYRDADNFTHVSISQKMFSLIANLPADEAEEKEILDAFGKLKGLKILSAEDVDGLKLYDEAFNKLIDNTFEELMSVREKDQDLKFMIKERDNGVIDELILIGGEKNEFFLLTMFGEVDLKQIKKISKSMDVEGFEHLDKLGDKKH